MAVGDIEDLLTGVWLTEVRVVGVCVVLEYI